MKLCLMRYSRKECPQGVVGSIPERSNARLANGPLDQGSLVSLSTKTSNILLKSYSEQY